MKAVIVDSNLLVLRVVGAADLAYIKVNKNTKNYGISDFEILDQLISEFAAVVLTPGILAETSNLAGQMREPARSEVFSRLRVLIDSCEEIHIQSNAASVRPEFQWLGFVDASLLALCLDYSDGLTLLTHDQRLAAAARNLSLSVEDFEGWR